MTDSIRNWLQIPVSETNHSEAKANDTETYNVEVAQDDTVDAVRGTPDTDPTHNYNAKAAEMYFGTALAEVMAEKSFHMRTLEETMGDVPRTPAVFKRESSPSPRRSSTRRQRLAAKRRTLAKPQEEHESYLATMEKSLSPVLGRHKSRHYRPKYPRHMVKELSGKPVQGLSTNGWQCFEDMVAFLELAHTAHHLSPNVYKKGVAYFCENGGATKRCDVTPQYESTYGECTETPPHVGPQSGQGRMEVENFVLMVRESCRSMGYHMNTYGDVVRDPIRCGTAALAPERPSTREMPLSGSNQEFHRSETEKTLANPMSDLEQVTELLGVATEVEELMAEIQVLAGQ